MHKVQINLPDGLYTVFQQVKDARGGSESDVGRAMIEYYLVQNSYLSNHLKEEIQSNNGDKADDD